MDDEKIPLDRRLSPSEIYRIQEFGRRFRELWDNFEDLKRLGLNFSGGFKLGKDGRLQGGDDLGVSRFRLKGFLVDYRHFSGNEPANLLSMLNLMAQFCTHPRLLEMIEVDRDQWRNSEGLCGWHNDFTADEFIDAHFKEEVFHTRPTGKVVKLRSSDVLAKMTNAVVWWEATYIAYTRMLVVRNTNYKLKPIMDGERALRLPGL